MTDLQAQLQEALADMSNLFSAQLQELSRTTALQVQELSSENANFRQHLETTLNQRLDEVQAELAQASRPNPPTHMYHTPARAPAPNTFPQAPTFPDPLPPTFPDPLPATSKEPRVDLPERFSGRPKDLRNFLTSAKNLFDLQPSRYSTDRAKVGLIGGQCTGDALTWYTTLVETESTLIRDYKEFIKAFKTEFGDPYAQDNARRTLLSMTQGRSSATTYAIRFRRAAVESGFNNETLMYVFKNGLNPEVRRATAGRTQEITSLDALIKFASAVDNDLFACSRTPSSRDWAATPTGTHSLPTVPASPLITDGPIPMEIGSTRTLSAPANPSRPRKLSTEEKEARRRQGLCLYCGKPGHMAFQCPAKSQGHQIAATTTTSDVVPPIQAKND